MTIGRHARYEIRYVRIDVVPRRGPQSAGMVILSALERYAYLIHAYCRRRLGDDTSPALLPGPEPSGLARAELPGKRARPVRGEAARQRAAATRQNGRSRSETETDETAHIA